MLQLLHPAPQVNGSFREPVEQLYESFGDRDDILGRLVVEAEELPLLRGQRQTAHGTRLSITSANDHGAEKRCGTAGGG
jgi:hypothetical protein